MTICIAATADANKAVVVASDRMLSAHFLSLEFDHPDSKIEQLGPSCMGLSAGDALPAGELFAASRALTAQLQDPAIVSIAESIRESYVQRRAQRIEEMYFRPRGLTLEAFYQQGMMRQFPAEVSVSLDERVQNFNFGVEIIVAGVDHTGAHIFGITNPGQSAPYERIGYHAIGSGMSHAILSLVSAGQYWRKSVEETVFNVYRAKRQAELAPGVGSSIEMRIITKERVVALTDEDFEKLSNMLEALLVPQEEQHAKRIHELSFRNGLEDDSA